MTLGLGEQLGPFSALSLTSSAGSRSCAKGQMPYLLHQVPAHGARWPVALDVEPRGPAAPAPNSAGAAARLAAV